MRLLHTMIRVGDLERSIAFYTQKLGMRLLRKYEVPADEYTLAFLGYGTEADSSVLELTYNYGVTSYTHGSGYGHIAIGVDDVKAKVEQLRTQGVPIDYEDDIGYMAFVLDPDGYRIELLDDRKMISQANAAMKEQGTA